MRDEYATVIPKWLHKRERLVHIVIYKYIISGQRLLVYEVMLIQRPLSTRNEVDVHEFLTFEEDR